MYRCRRDACACDGSAEVAARLEQCTCPRRLRLRPVLCARGSVIVSLVWLPCTHSSSLYLYSRHSMGMEHGRCRFTQYPVRLSGYSDGVGPCASPYSSDCLSIIYANNASAATFAEQAVYVSDLDMTISYQMNASVLERCLPGSNQNPDSWDQTQVCNTCSCCFLS